MYTIAKYMAAAALVIYMTSCEQANRYLGLEDDNVFEELIEDAIEIETGADIDLTPSSPEKPSLGGK